MNQSMDIKIKSRGNLLLCSLSRVIIGSILRPITQETMSFDLVNGTKHGLQLLR